MIITPPSPIPDGFRLLPRPKAWNEDSGNKSQWTEFPCTFEEFQETIASKYALQAYKFVMSLPLKDKPLSICLWLSDLPTSWEEVSASAKYGKICWHDENVFILVKEDL
jgi:hypothetical protein